jgi:hypothetical protein
MTPLPKLEMVFIFSGTEREKNPPKAYTKQSVEAREKAMATQWGSM